MKIYKDARINASSMNVHTYIKIVFLILVICAMDSFICFKFMQMHSEQLYMYLSILGYTLFVSIVFLSAINIYRKYYFMKPVYELSQAAKKVAEGDYTVQLASRRKDGKKDEFEVLYDDFNQMVLELQSTELMKNDFLANVSHELKTPLSVINNYATILQDTSLTEMQRVEYSKRIAEASTRLSVLVTNILRLNRLEHQNIVPNKKSYNLSEQLCRCLLGFDQMLDAKDINLETNFEEIIMIEADESLLDIVWNNLLSNAIKFTEQGGCVRIEVKKDADYVIVNVQDSGCGIGEKDRIHIFEKFYQADTSRSTQGNGLGLAMVLKIVELFDGIISVKSELKKGTEICVKLHCGALSTNT